MENKKFLNFFQRRVKVVEFDRIFLHSTKIGFNDLNNQWLEFESKLPKELTEILDAQKTK